MKEMLFYRCEKCGNMVALVKAGGGELTCCGQAMTKLQANTTDASQEKHVPAVVYENGKIKVAIGSIPHPMLVEHHIEWIALVAGNKFEMVYLKPGMEAKADFMCPMGEVEDIYVGKEDEIVPNCEGNPCNFVSKDKSLTEVTVYEYCNLHGLWQAKFSL
ncbi:MAG: desulfoferrodoxin FeS4 iron-binding protein [Clostridia bacterium]|jgi:superoxide reductase|nr:desulfoferrodoxin FeS4 iron-binding protein [Clostridia bacterium]